MAISSSPARSLFFATLIMVLLTGCGGSSAEIIAPGPDSEVKPTEPSGEAGTATIRIERTGITTGVDWHWEVYGEFPITLYFDEGDDSPIFFSTGKGTAVMTSSEVGFTGITSHTTTIWDVDFEVRGVFNAKDCSVEIYIKEVWAEGAEMTHEVEGVVISGQMDEFIIFTENTYEHKSLKFPLGIGQVSKPQTMGNAVWDATFTITSLSVPEFTGCGSFEYQDETLETSENGS
ncbi:MAG: hypothetical protein U9N80_15580 [Chloroflexota bacterium]|nr:hypothetical protein [Chloroflexota bacterium]